MSPVHPDVARARARLHGAPRLRGAASSTSMAERSPVGKITIEPSSAQVNSISRLKALTP
jgi:hypothetical protein